MLAHQQLTRHLSNLWRQHNNSRNNILSNQTNNNIRLVNNRLQVNLFNRLFKVKQGQVLICKANPLKIFQYLQ